MAERPHLPGWPRGMPEWMAAEYLGLSAGIFRAQVMPEVGGVQVSERVRIWVKEDLDAWLDRRAGRMPRSAGNNPWDDV